MIYTTLKNTAFALLTGTLVQSCASTDNSKIQGLGPNPFITNIYTADPSAHVWKDGRLYVYPSHDVDPPRGCDLMDQYHVFSTTDMVNWVDHGEILNSGQVEWGRPEGGFMWAPDCAYKKGNYYFYFPHPSGTDWNHTWKVGVAVSKHPAKKFKVKGYIQDLGDAFAMIDPCVFVDDDGQAYFYYGGGGRCVGARLKDNMIELAEPLRAMEGLKDFHEATWVHKRNGIYYLSYSDNHSENGRGANRLHYAMSNNPLGPWEYKGIFLEPTGCDTSHGSIVKYKGEWFAFYHNQDISGQGNLRSICVDRLFYNDDGTIQPVIQHKAATKTYNSYKGLVMAGYQGWFSTPEDGGQRGWYHYRGSDGFKPGSASIDLWPDVSEYTKTYESPFTFEDGSNAKLFSSRDASTVDTHFRWMQEYGLDGVFMQRFVSEIKRPLSKAHLDTVLRNAMISAQRWGRAISIMYDLSGMHPGDEQLVLNDIQELAKHYDIFNHKKCPSYLYHNGKPLIAVWGVGFSDGREYSLDNCNSIIDGLKKLGFSIMIGVPTHWRELSQDAINDSRLHQIIRKCDIVMPWFVGRYNESTFESFKSLISSDIKWARENNIDYAPLCYPGFSWHNMHYPNKDLTEVPRNKGAFFSKQLDFCLNSGAKMLYIAMFDEIDEGTAIFKISHRVPVPTEGSRFVPLEDGLDSGYYMHLAGEAARRLKNSNK